MPIHLFAIRYKDSGMVIGTGSTTAAALADAAFAMSTCGEAMPSLSSGQIEVVEYDPAKMGVALRGGIIVLAPTEE